MNIGILCSGGLGFELLKKTNHRFNTSVVFTDKNSVSIIDFCTKQNIPLFVGNPRNGRGYAFIKDYEVDILISINYLFLIESDIISYPTKLAFNVHGSLLPKYRGRTPHVWAIINNEQLTGITAHKIDVGCDTGDIISQIKIVIDENDTGNDVLLKFHENYEKIVFDVIKQLQTNSINYITQDNTLATYFGKRTPDDGHIDWNWQKERIRNWVRAQALPYPGAFSFLNNNKVTIDEVVYTNKGFSFNMPNGLIMANCPILVKTPNGVIEIRKHRENISFTKGEILI